MSIPTAPPSGFRDFLPEQVALRHDAIETITRVYRSFGFQPVATSAVEDLQVLMGKGGGENEKLIFKIQKRGEKLLNEAAAAMANPDRQTLDYQEIVRQVLEEAVEYGLRFDLTLPLARYYSKYGSQLPRPFKAFHLGPVWRAERAQKGRFREFTQCDVDIIGSDSWGAEVDVITAILAVFEALKISGVKVLINDRSLVYAALDHAGVPENKRVSVCVAIDKLDKVPREKVLMEITEMVGNNCATVLQQTLLADSPNINVYEQAQLTGSEQYLKLEKIVRTISADSTQSIISISPSLMRGFDYYTGPVFEFRHASLSGSLGGGGRYDKLTEKFGGQPTPACGGSIGFERLMLILEETQTSAGTKDPDAVIALFSDELRERSLEIAAVLRNAGLTADVYPGKTGKMGPQFNYATLKKAAYCVMLDPRASSANAITIKDMATQAEKEILISDLVKTIKADRPA